MSEQPIRRRLSGPLWIALGAAALGLLLAIIGIARGQVPLNPLSIFLALFSSGGAWGLVAWAIATAAADVEADVAAAEDRGGDASPPTDSPIR